MSNTHLVLVNQEGEFGAEPVNEYSWQYYSLHLFKSVNCTSRMLCPLTVATCFNF